MSFNLKHIPCPRGEECNAFKCLFGHPNEDAPAPAAAPATHGAKRGRHGDGASSSDHEGPPKRPRVDRLDKSAALSDEGTADDKRVVGSNATARRRSLPPSSAGYKANAGTKNDGSIKSSAFSRTSDAARSAGVAAKPGSSLAVKGNGAAVSFVIPKDQSKQKTESLNPRLLVSSPASHEIRVKLLKLLHQEYHRLNTELKKDASNEEMKLVMSSSELVTKALDDEQTVAQDKPAVYANVMKNRVMAHKRMGVAQWKSERDKEMNPSGSGGGKRNNPNDIDTGLTLDQEVAMLKHLLTPVDGLSKFGYVPKVPSEETVEEVRAAIVAGRGWEKCDRCQQRFQVFPGRREEDGALTSGGACNFHWGKRYVPVKAPGDKSRPRKRYQCCGEEEGESSGCLTHDHHVYKATDALRLATLFNFVETPQNELAPIDRAVCFDCEMGYTVHGMELVRLTATSWPTGKELLDVLVQPKGEVLDLNSRYSGVWPDDLALAELWTGQEIPPLTDDGDGAQKKLKKVQSPAAARDLLFSLISPDTPLIGHGLENDLNACRIVHPTLIDTVLLYPHRAGLPYRRGLKGLVEEQLGYKIQQDTGPETLGHDSAEDARAAGDLVRWEVKHNWREKRQNGWIFYDGDATEGPRLEGPRLEGPCLSTGGEDTLEHAPERPGGGGKLTEDFIEDGQGRV
ncbi:hypothetical protein G6O67_008585 [Ophiocordyceps sinensis]|uniref:Exonuclease domain-containing protein n=1 Tax=Ophiocordyceps sinensis TaxID=72228 RepID=A0A8H4LRH5_9HYPO|nr:hypothetical protein G6O67_008585 [Ophiocordyceps sinensis]